MSSKKTIACVGVVALVFLSSAIFGQPQGGEKYRAKLGVVPIAGAAGRNNIDENPMVPATALISATLGGTKLTITGTFEGLKSAATIAQVHQGLMTGVRGPVVFDLTITKANKGSLSGTFDLTPEQVNLLRSGRLYIQIHSQSSPDGSLWGWLLK